MANECIVLIGQAEALTALQTRAGSAGEMLTYRDTDAVEALQTIITRRPRAVVLERLFAATPRGVALINRIKADPTLAGSEIRVVAHDSDYARVVRRAGTTQPVAAPAPDAAPASTAAAQGAVAQAAAAPTATPASTAPLDQKGTRRAPRYRMRDGLELQLDGNPATIIDLSAFGAQVISPTILRPNQRVRVLIPTEPETLRFGGAVAWASFEMSRTPGVPHYRAGVEFFDADARAIDAFSAKHRKT
jgi:hypothetical protein